MQANKIDFPLNDLTFEHLDDEIISKSEELYKIIQVEAKVALSKVAGTQDQVQQCSSLLSNILNLKKNVDLQILQPRLIYDGGRKNTR